jgi:hypothetical protein
MKARERWIAGVMLGAATLGVIAYFQIPKVEGRPVGQLASTTAGSSQPERRPRPERPSSPSPVPLAKLALDPHALAAENARSIVEAARTGRHPERLNPLVVPPAFDRDAFARNPRAYYEVIEPGRVFQPAEAGPGVSTLDSTGPTHLETVPEGSVRLEVRGEPLSPVTFTSFDRGAFDNDLGSITVQADAGGTASARFRATSGTIDDVNILSASPLSAGQVAFLVTVRRD